MPVPKKRVGHSEQGHRRSKWKAFLPSLTRCQKCGDVKLTHKLCLTCGSYKDLSFEDHKDLVRDQSRLSN